MQEWQEWCFPGGEEEEGKHFPNLCELSLENCPKLTWKISLDYFPRLERLSLQKVKIESLASCSQECNKFNIELPSLRELEISDFQNLSLFIEGCKEFKSFPEESKFPSLDVLEIMACPEFVGFRNGGDARLSPVPGCFGDNGVPRICGFPHGRGLQVPNLKEIKIYECNKFRSLPEEMQISLPSLESLFIGDCRLNCVPSVSGVVYLLLSSTPELAR
ncbi:hypothetical protein PS2_006028 [Malus domestica]